MSFVPSWSSDHAIRAARRLNQSGRYCTVVPRRVTPKPAMSLSRYRLSYYLQGQAGCCWTHSAKQMFEVSANASGYPAFPASRRLIGYAAKEMFEGGDNQALGGSPTDAVVVMTDKGVGIANEAICPYSDDYRILGQRPPQAAYDDARRTHLVAPVKLTQTADVVAMINAGKPVCNGFQVPVELQQPNTFITSYSSILGGHSMLIWGYAREGVFDEYFYWELEGWWDAIYPVLPPSLASRVDGYDPVRPDKTTSVWMRADVYASLCGLDVYREHVSATDIDGMDPVTGVVVPAPSFADAFVI